MDDRSHAHDAGLYSTVYSGSTEAVVAKVFGSLPKSQYFSMSSGIRFGNGLVVSSADNFAVGVYHNRSYRNLIIPLGVLCLLQGQHHVYLMTHGFDYIHFSQPRSIQI